MAGPSWLVDSKRIATKIKSASDPRRVKWKSNPTRACPNCNHIIDNSDVTQEWPGLPRGVKFDPSDQEIILHLLAQVGVGDVNPHPFIDEFIPTVDEDDGICYTHPQNLPGVKQDGSVSHFFHRAIKAYNTGTRKRRKIQDDDHLGDVRWHKTGKTKPIIVDGIHRGCKKIMVLYMSMVRGGKPEKTNWVMHQYHLGTGEDEKDGEFVVSKVFYQQQVKQGDKTEQELPLDNIDSGIAKVDPVTPKSMTPEPLCTDRQYSDFNPGQQPAINCMDPPAQHPEARYVEEEVQPEWDKLHNQDQLMEGNTDNQMVQPEWDKHDDQDHLKAGNTDNQMVQDQDNHTGEDPKWWEGESQFLLDSQQLVEGLSLCDELLQSQTSNVDGDDERKIRPRLSDYARLGAEDLKKDLEECQSLGLLVPANIELDTPPDFRLSQLEFGSQESFTAWGGSKVGD